MAQKRGESAKRDDSGRTQLILLVILLIFLAIIDISTLAVWKFSFSPSPSTPKEETSTVTEVISGNIIKLSDGRTVKLIGIDSPSPGQNYYEESVNMLKFLVLDKEVRLESDVEDKDSGGNLLRYVYVNYNNKELFVNLESVRQGYSLPFHIGANVKHRTEIEAARTECMTNKLNLCS